MKSLVTDDFLACFAKLPEEVKEQARRGYALWRQNPYHPGLHFKRIHGREAIYSVRIGRGWRALGLVQTDSIHWFWIGSHAEYDNLLG